MQQWNDAVGEIDKEVLLDLRFRTLQRQGEEPVGEFWERLDKELRIEERQKRRKIAEQVAVELKEL